MEKIKSLKKILLVIVFALFCGLIPSKVVSASDGWGDFGSSIQWYFRDKDGVLEISGSGEMPDVSNVSIPWRSYGGKIKKVVINEGITSISDSAFGGFSNLTVAELPSSLRYIEPGAFAETGIKKITLPEGLLKIGSAAFYGCEDLSYIRIPGTVHTVSYAAFSQCKNLKKITLSPGIRTLEMSCFSYTGITDISIPSSVTMIDSMTFQSCENMRTVEIPSTVTDMGEAVFSWCNNLKYVYFNASCIIPKHTFGSSGVEVVKIGEATKGIDEYAFSWTNLKAIYIPVTATTFYTDSIDPSYSEEVFLYGYSGSAAWKYAGINPHITFIDVGVSEGLSAWNKQWDSVRRITINSGNTKVTLSSYSYIYNGKMHTPTVTVKYNGETLKNNKDYTISFSTGRKNVGKYTVKVTFKGLYKGSLSKMFKVLPSKTSFTKVKSGKNAFSVSWKRISSQISGYQLSYDLDKNFKTARTLTVKSTKTNNITVRKLLSSRKYYLRIRTYKRIGNIVYYSPWSSEKAVSVR